MRFAQDTVRASARVYVCSAGVMQTAREVASAYRPETGTVTWSTSSAERVCATVCVFSLARQVHKSALCIGVRSAAEQ